MKHSEECEEHAAHRWTAFNTKSFTLKSHRGSSSSSCGVASGDRKSTAARVQSWSIRVPPKGPEATQHHQRDSARANKRRWLMARSGRVGPYSGGAGAARWRARADSHNHMSVRRSYCRRWQKNCQLHETTSFQKCDGRLLKTPARGWRRTAWNFNPKPGTCQFLLSFLCKSVALCESPQIIRSSDLSTQCLPTVAVLPLSLALLLCKRFHKVFFFSPSKRKKKTTDSRKLFSESYWKWSELWLMFASTEDHSMGFSPNPFILNRLSTSESKQSCFWGSLNIVRTHCYQII